MEKEAPNKKKQKNPSQPKPEGLKQKAIKQKRSSKSKNKKNPSKPKPDGLKPKAIKWKKKPRIKKQKKFYIALTRRA